MPNFTEPINLIKASENILILTHKNPDGDAVGSVLGLGMALESLDKNCGIILRDKIPKVLEFLPGQEKVRYAENLTENDLRNCNYDLVILADCAELERTGIKEINKVVEAAENLLIVDHHPEKKIESENFKISKIINPKYSSAAEMLFELFMEMGIKINKDIAQCLLTGIFTDTGGFQHANVSPKTLEAAAELMKKGPRINKITQNIFNSKSIPAIKIWGRALTRIETDSKNGMSVSYIGKEDLEECGASYDDLSGIANIINTISDSKFSLLLTEYENKKIRGSLRSNEYKGVDVSKIAHDLGGGGHRLASGFELKGTIKESLEIIYKKLKGQG